VQGCASQLVREDEDWALSMYVSLCRNTCDMAIDKLWLTVDRRVLAIYSALYFGRTGLGRHLGNTSDRVIVIIDDR